MHQLELILVALLLLVIAFGALASRLKTPYPIVLMLGGLLLSVVPGVPRFSLNPNLVFLVILPPLLFAAAFTTSWRDFRYNLATILSLAFGLVGFTVAGVAIFAHWIIPGFDWRLGLVLGAVVATTDAIAATSIAKRVGLPQRIIDILEGESLVNDASGLLALQFTVAFVVSGRPPALGQGVLQMAWLMGGGILIGLVVGQIVYIFEQWIDDAPIEITASIVTPFVAYLGAEAVHSSGVLAAVACGLFLGRKSSVFFSSSVRLEAWATWNTLTFGLNGLVFILLGLQLPFILARIGTQQVPHLLLDAAEFSAAVIVLRLLWVFPARYGASFLRRRILHQSEKPPDARSTFVVGWTGMRGVIALAAAISLPETLADGSRFPQRDEIIFLTFCVIFVTLVVQGLTLPSVIRHLQLPHDEEMSREEEEARRQMIGDALSAVQELRTRDDPEHSDVYDHIVQQYCVRLSMHPEDGDADGPLPEKYRVYRATSQALRAVERSSVLKMRDQNKINDEVLRKLERELDLLDTRYQS